MARCLRDADARVTPELELDQRPYFRMLVNLLQDLQQEPEADGIYVQVLTAMANLLHLVQPLQLPAFAFAWLELVSHRKFMPRLLMLPTQKGWRVMQALLTDLLRFMEPLLRPPALTPSVRCLYKGTLRVLLVLLHDFPEFLCDYHLSFCDTIPECCIQLRNLVLSASPRNMRLPDPFTPNLKVDLLAEISQPPRIVSNYTATLGALKPDLDAFLRTRSPAFLAELPAKLAAPAPSEGGARYNLPLINALSLYIGVQAIQQSTVSGGAVHSVSMEIFHSLVNTLDAEGRYHVLNSIANQLRYPNSHTHYFSCVLLNLFADATREVVREQITRVLLERLIVHKPHPWGLLVTFIELIKNSRYAFWNHGFTRCAPEIERLFESVARSCMGPPVRGPEDEGELGLPVPGIMP